MIHTKKQGNMLNGYLIKGFMQVPREHNRRFLQEFRRCNVSPVAAQSSLDFHMTLGVVSVASVFGRFRPCIHFSAKNLDTAYQSRSLDSRSLGWVLSLSFFDIILFKVREGG